MRVMTWNVQGRVADELGMHAVTAAELAGFDRYLGQ